MVRAAAWCAAKTPRRHAPSTVGGPAAQCCTSTRSAVDLTHEKWHPAMGVCLTSNVTLGSSKSEPRGKSEVFDELPWQTRVVGAGGASL